MSEFDFDGAPFRDELGRERTLDGQIVNWIIWLDLVIGESEDTTGKFTRVRNDLESHLGQVGREDLKRLRTPTGGV